MTEQDAQLAQIAVQADQTLTWTQTIITEGINSDHDYELAGSIVRRAQQEKKAAEAEYQHLYRPIKTAMDRLRARWKEVSAPWDEAQTILRAAMTTYATEKEQASREEALKLAAAARKEMEKPEASVEKVESLVAKAQAIDESAPQVEGVSYRENWTAEVDDLIALCAAVAAGDVPADLVQPNMKRLREMAKAMKDTFKVPGCRAVVKKVMQVRGSR